MSRRRSSPAVFGDRPNGQAVVHVGDASMKLGLLSAPFPETSLLDVADWTAANGFESLEIACWPRTTGPTRRYAGTSHIDVANLSATQARDIVDEIGAKGLTISGLGYYPNPLHPDRAHRAMVIDHLRQVIGRGREDGRSARQHVHGRRRREDPGAELGRRPPGLAGHRGLRPGSRPPDHDRELPDALQLRRVAGRAQPGDDAPGSGAGSSSSGAARSGSTSTRRT